MDPLRYVADTMALAGYLIDVLPKPADRCFRQAEQGQGEVAIPEVAFGELSYLVMKGRISLPNPKIALQELLQFLEASDAFPLAPMGQDAWRHFLESSIPELHDRMIWATARARSATLITSDPVLRAAGPAVWD